MERVIASPAEAEALFAALAREQREVAAFAYLGPGRRLLGMRHIRSPWADAVGLPVRAVMIDALAFGATGLLMAHNHPSGDCRPSAVDRQATSRIARALAAIDVCLLDHMVVARDGVTSFRRLGWL